MGCTLRKGADLTSLAFDADELEALIVGMRFAQPFARTRLAAASMRALLKSKQAPLYQKLLADAAGILAALVAPETTAIIAARVAAHERLWGHKWLQDPVFSNASSAWANAKKALGQAATQ